MTEPQPENGQEAIDESGRNPTQQEIDERGASDAPVDTEWETGTGSDDGGPGSGTR